MLFLWYIKNKITVQDEQVQISTSCIHPLNYQISSREAIGDLLKLDEYIDLVIPRGSSDLVKTIKEQSKMIPGKINLDNSMKKLSKIIV